MRFTSGAFGRDVDETGTVRQAGAREGGCRAPPVRTMPPARTDGRRATYTEEHKRDCPYLSCRCGPCQAIGLRRKLRAEANRDKRQRTLRMMSAPTHRTHLQDAEAAVSPSSVASAGQTTVTGLPGTSPTTSPSTFGLVEAAGFTRTLAQPESHAIPSLAEMPASTPYHVMVPVVCRGPSLSPLEPSPNVASTVGMWYPPYAPKALQTPLPPNTIALSSLSPERPPYWKEVVHLPGIGFGPLPHPPVVPLTPQLPTAYSPTCRPSSVCPPVSHQLFREAPHSLSLAIDRFQAPPSVTRQDRSGGGGGVQGGRTDSRNSSGGSSSSDSGGTRAQACAAEGSSLRRSNYDSRGQTTRQASDSPPLLTRTAATGDSPISTVSSEDTQQEGEPGESYREPTARDLLAMIDSFPSISPHSLFDILHCTGGDLNSAMRTAADCLRHRSSTGAALPPSSAEASSGLHPRRTR